MNTDVGRPQIGQWYLRADKGEIFQVVGYDDRSHTIEIQSFDGEVDEMDDETWDSLSLERSEPPENWTGPMDNVETDDLGYSDTEMKPGEWTGPLQPVKIEGEAWEDTEPEEERNPLGEERSADVLSTDAPEVSGRT